jgi:hypothetical protein
VWGGSSVCGGDPGTKAGRSSRPHMHEARAIDAMHKAYALTSTSIFVNIGSWDSNEADTNGGCWGLCL